MGGRPRFIDPQKALEEDLRGEKAGAMGRVARVLDGLLERLASLRAQLDGASGEARAELLAAYERTRREAERYRWYLVVQREAMGLRDHRALDEHYRLPPRLK